MDVRERDSGETEDRSVNEEKQIDNIIFNLIRRNAKFIDMSNEYQKKIYSQE